MIECSRAASRLANAEADVYVTCARHLSHFNSTGLSELFNQDHPSLYLTYNALTHILSKEKRLYAFKHSLN